MGVTMRGVEILRNIYIASALKEIIRAWGMNPEEILTRKALSMPYRTYATQNKQKNK